MSSSSIASKQGLEKARKSLISIGFVSQEDLAQRSMLSRSTVARFFAGKPIRTISFKDICDTLHLDWTQIIEIEEKQPEELENNTSDEIQHNTVIPILESEKKLLNIGSQFVTPNIHYDFQGANFHSGVVIHNHTPEQKQSITYNFQGANFHSGVVIHNHTPEQKQNLVEAAVEIQQLLKQLEKNHPCDTTVENMAVANEAIKLIESNPLLKQRIINVIKAGGTEAFIEFLSHPAANFIIGALAGS